MRSLVLAIGFALSIATPAVAQHSWGRTGVSFSEYRQDAFNCTWSATIAMMSEYGISSEGSGPAALVTGGGASTAVNTGPAGNAGAVSQGAGDSTLDPMAVYLTSYLMERHRDLRVERNLRQEVVDQCLLALGYQRFRLTDEQRARLRTLAHGTEERHRYLYGLGTDAAVLASQADPPEVDYSRIYFHPPDNETN